MRLTRRGWLLIVVLVAAVGSGLFFGARSLNAVVAPAIVALVAAVVQVWWIDRPTLDRELPAHGHRGGTVPVRLAFGGGSAFSARVHDAVDGGLDATGNDRETVVDGGAVEYTLHLRDRGDRRVGPATVEARDVLGLVSTTFRYPDRDRLVVRPRVYPLVGPRRGDLVLLYGEPSADRSEFDQLRRYRRGDPLRDVHWKSSAKLPGDELAVKQFIADEASRTVELAATATVSGTDAMADATASVAVHLLDAGVSVGLTTAAGRIEPDSGPDHRNRILDHLARIDAGRLRSDVRAAADVVIQARGDEARVEFRGLSRPFAEFAGSRPDRSTESRRSAPVADEAGSIVA